MSHSSHFAFLVILAAIALQAAPRPAAAQPKAVDRDARAIVQGSNDFALDLYARLAIGEGNVFFSPHSIHCALSMTCAGARGPTAEQMVKTLHLTPEGAKAHSAYGAFLKSLAPNERLAVILPANNKPQPNYELTVANALWCQRGYPFHKDFQDLVKVNYGAGLNDVDYIRATEEARKTINAWVEKETKEKIKDLVPEGVLNELTRMVLTNAIYFKSAWAEPFKKEMTKDAPFHLAGGKTADVPLMREVEHMGYAEADTFQAVELSYRQYELSMVILVPRKADGLAEVEKSLTGQTLAKSLEGMQGRRVDFSLPRFKVTGQFRLAEQLKGMGMPLAFDADKADFSAMATLEKLHIAEVVHKAYVDVDEAGTEAAAATAVMMAAGGVAVPTEPVVIKADHPFIYIIRHRATGAILFMGRLTNPK